MPLLIRCFFPNDTCVEHAWGEMWIFWMWIFWDVNTQCLIWQRSIWDGNVVNKAVNWECQLCGPSCSLLAQHLFKDVSMTKLFYRRYFLFIRHSNLRDSITHRHLGVDQRWQIQLKRMLTAIRHLNTQLKTIPVLWHDCLTIMLKTTESLQETETPMTKTSASPRCHFERQRLFAQEIDPTRPWSLLIVGAFWILWEFLWPVVQNYKQILIWSDGSY